MYRIPCFQINRPLYYFHCWFISCELPRHLTDIRYSDDLSSPGVSNSLRCRLICFSQLDGPLATEMAAGYYHSYHGPRPDKSFDGAANISYAGLNAVPLIRLSVHDWVRVAAWRLHLRSKTWGCLSNGHAIHQVSARWSFSAFSWLLLNIVSL